MRAFIALELPPLFTDEVTALSNRLERLIEGRFMDRSTFHLTIAFLGDISEHEVSRAIDILDAVGPNIEPPLLTCTGLGKFGRASDATLWLGIENVPELAQLAGDVRAELDKHGIFFDSKPFKPHITLARHAQLSKTTLDELPFPTAARADTVTLFKSTLTQQGAIYAPLYTTTLD